MTTNRSKSVRRPQAGWIALAVTALNAGIVSVALLTAGEGVAGIGVVVLIVLFTFPVILVSLIIGVIGIRRRSGKAPAVIAVVLNTAALTVSAFEFFRTQVY